MTETSPESPAADLLGLVCVGCEGNTWKVVRTRLGSGVVRRWRQCLQCGHGIRTREAIEAEAHPDRDVA